MRTAAGLVLTTRTARAPKKAFDEHSDARETLGRTAEKPATKAEFILRTLVRTSRREGRAGFRSAIAQTGRIVDRLFGVQSVSGGGVPEAGFRGAPGA